MTVKNVERYFSFIHFLIWLTGFIQILKVVGDLGYKFGKFMATQ